jgi:hypothetical protein
LGSGEAAISLFSILEALMPFEGTKSGRRFEEAALHSTAWVGGHPLHPMFVQFPIVCFSDAAALAAELAAAEEGSP